jgi:hypothetical protein
MMIEQPETYDIPTQYIKTNVFSDRMTAIGFHQNKGHDAGAFGPDRCQPQNVGEILL